MGDERVSMERARDERSGSCRTAEVAASERGRRASFKEDLRSKRRRSEVTGHRQHVEVRNTAKIDKASEPEHC